MEEKKLIQVSVKDKKDYILEKEDIKGKVREFLNRYHKVEVKLISILDSIILSGKLNYSKRSYDFDRIRKPLNEMESILNESNPGETTRNSNDKS